MFYLIFKSIYIRHKDRINYIKEKMPDFKLVEIWEHEWKGKLDEVVDEIIPREALSGGHTMAFNLYYKSTETIYEHEYLLLSSLSSSLLYYHHFTLPTRI